MGLDRDVLDVRELRGDEVTGYRHDWARLAALADVAGTPAARAAADRLDVELRRLTAVERDARTARMVIEGPLHQEIERLRAEVARLDTLGQQAIAAEARAVAELEAENAELRAKLVECAIALGQMHSELWGWLGDLADEAPPIERNEGQNTALIRRASIEIDTLRARLDEIEAGEIRTKWAVRYGPNDIEACDDEIEARREAAEPDGSGELVSRTIRYSPWTVTQ